MEGFYSRLVAWLKILLPLLALGILSSVVFFARDSEDARDIPFFSEGSDEAGERIANPEYMGVTQDGATIRVRADRVTPEAGDPDTLRAERLTSRMETKSGRIIQATAPEGRLSIAKDIAELIGIVSVDTSDGFSMIAQDLTTNLDTGFAESGGAVRGEAPFGDLEAGRMRYGVPDTRSDLLVFNGGVKLIYRPKD